MGQPHFPRLFLLLTLSAWIATLPACRRRADDPPPAAARPSVACLVPAATDILLAMDAAAHLAAISNFDPDRQPTRNLPRVGDYQGLDWEKVLAIRPDLLVVQIAPDRMPPGLGERTESAGIRLVNVRINRLGDVFTATEQLGEAIGRPDLSASAVGRLRDRLAAVRARVEGRPNVRVYLARGDSPFETVGGGNFLDDLLVVAGGSNVIQGGDNYFPTIDRERLMAADPDVVVHLMPAATPQTRAAVERAWGLLGDLRAVREGRLYFVTEDFALLPGGRVGELAELLAALLHPN